MADVRPRRPPADGGPWRRWRGDSGSRSRSRGQLLLVTSLAVAVLLVSLALLLNTAIYTENLATRNADPGSANAVSYQREAVQGVGGIVSYVNTHHAENETALDAELAASVEVWDNATARHAAVDANAVGVSVATSNGTRAVEYGTQVVQNRTRNFTAANGSADWVVAENVTPRRGVRAFRLSVRPDELATNRSGAFRVDVTAAAETWRVYVYTNGSAVQVDNGTAPTDADCSAVPTNGTVAVDLTAGTVGGRACNVLSALADADSGPDERFDVSYRNADRVTGTYSAVLNQSSPGPNAGPYHLRSSGDAPYVAPAVYAVAVDVSFESGRVTYETTVRVAPGEGDDR